MIFFISVFLIYNSITSQNMLSNLKINNSQDVQNLIDILKSSNNYNSITSLNQSNCKLLESISKKKFLKK